MNMGVAEANETCGDREVKIEYFARVNLRPSACLRVNERKRAGARLLRQGAKRPASPDCPSFRVKSRGLPKD